MRNHWFLWYNLICMLCVIHHHMAVAAPPVWVSRVGMVVIPLFSMLAGYSWGGFLRKSKGAGAFYALKLFAYPYFFWAVVYYVMNFVVLDVFIRHQAFEVPSFGDWLNMLLTGGVAVHLWFLPVLIYISAFTALLARLIKNKWAFLSIIGIVALVSLIYSALPEIGPSRFVHFLKTYAFWLFPNFCLGILLSAVRSDWFRGFAARRLLVLLAPVSIAMLFLPPIRGTETLTTVVLVGGALSFPQIVPAPKWLVATAPYVMGIYLVHALVVAMVTIGLRFVGIMELPNVTAWGVAVVILFVSMGWVWLQRKVPCIRHFV